MPSKSVSRSGVLRFDNLRLFCRAKRESRKETEEPESIRVVMFLMFGDFSEIYRALDSEQESEPESTPSRICGGLEANTLCVTGVSAVVASSLGGLKA